MAGKPAQFRVLLTGGAERDLEALYDYVVRSDGSSKAHHLLDHLMETVESLAKFPARGSHPKELAALGIKEYRQVLFKPYRVIYRIVDRQVIIYLIVDGRRDMQSVLALKLLGA
jgi:toxin ParE1/3/4